jgi:hypothetical protein
MRLILPKKLHHIQVVIALSAATLGQDLNQKAFVFSQLHQRLYQGKPDMDPVSCVALATGAFKALKGAVAAGRDFQDMTSQLSTWGKAFSDFNEIEKREKDPPFWKKTFKGSDEETAIEIFANKKKMEQMRAEIKDHISWTYGPSAWKEVLQIEAQMRKQRKDELYRKARAGRRCDKFCNRICYIWHWCCCIVWVVLFLGKQAR